MRALFVLVLGALALAPCGGLAAQAARRAPPPREWSRPQKCEGYCTPDGWKVCRAADLRAEPRPNAPVVGHVVRGDRLRWLDGRMVVTTPGLVVFTDTVRYSPDSGGHTEFTHYVSPMLGERLFGPADTITILDSDDEGDVGIAWRIWVDGHPVGVWEFWRRFDPIPGLHVVREPVQVLWAKVRSRRGATGWLPPTLADVRGDDYYNREMDCTKHS